MLRNAIVLKTLLLLRVRLEMRLEMVVTGDERVRKNSRVSALYFSH